MLDRSLSRIRAHDCDSCSFVLFDSSHPGSVASEIFAEFVQSLGVSHIREYEEKLLTEVKVRTAVVTYVAR